MALIKSISGIRGTIGGKISENLTPLDIVKFTSAYGTWLLNHTKPNAKISVVIGRDARISGGMVNALVSNTLIGLGIDVVDLGLSTTPTVELAVPLEFAQGGIIITASHNPKQWNALKLLDSKGEFVNAAVGKYILDIAKKDAYTYAKVENLGTYIQKNNYIQKHLQHILDLEMVDTKAIQKANFKIVVDAVNSTGGIFIPELLKRLGATCVKMYCEPNGNFPHNPEPLKEHLTEISKKVIIEKADLGIVVDPDVDRLAIISEDGEMFGEEYTLVACADYILSRNGGGNTVSNLSSSRALKDITQKHNGKYTASAVGEVHVVAKMKDTKAIIGGEGNGGIIYPDSHYGRDALVGIALFLSHLAREKKKCSILRKKYPNYFMSKNKIELPKNLNVDTLLKKVATHYKNENIQTIDGVKIDFPEEWVHLRKSNTEPIIRIYTESSTQEKAENLAKEIINLLKK